jgi:hypothetical protein
VTGVASPATSRDDRRRKHRSTPTTHTPRKQEPFAMQLTQEGKGESPKRMKRKRTKRRETDTNLKAKTSKKKRNMKRRHKSERNAKSLLT